MKTIIYMVRHAESPYTEGNERTRGLTLEGKMNAETITEILKDEGINIIVSSPYARAILTLEGLAKELELDIKIFEDLRERHFSGEDYIISNEEFMPAIKKMFDDPNYALPGGESNTVCQNRSVVVLKNILEEYKGKKVAIGTHGNVMTLMMNYFDSNYGLDFLNQTKKPDIYKMHFKDLVLEEVTKLWKE
ncbi:histidine phosphatase family protein [Paenibacillus alginolyticus]|uniref:Histidine phosphatase family protein n=1 Tax=Paenibacillus alginolyticus TaxID=59839 RepID=A0ABT4GFD2_9BACL|nr:histidine phosphatase family protein [Paenibacillus alginolyticus]MCY9694773.1 histidine phosphatase family protein [Paenibacillus alginolyticus]MEC0147055.1 histidine phosphatase family protein [Paenibacillus alginolyticus]